MGPLSRSSATVRLHEVIVVHDGSTDDTLDMVQRYGDAIKVYSQLNKGLAHTLNAAIGYATGTYVAFADADDLWVADKLARQVSNRLPFSNRKLILG